MTPLYCPNCKCVLLVSEMPFAWRCRGCGCNSNNYRGCNSNNYPSVTYAYTYADTYAAKDRKEDKKMSNIKEAFRLAFMDEPEKSFRKAGITNGDDFLTDDGLKVFLGWLLKKHGEEFKKEVVDLILADQAKSNK